MFVSVGFMSVLQKMYYEYSGEERKLLVGTCISWYLLASTILFVPVILFKNDLSDLLFQSPEYGYTILVVLIIIILQLLVDIPFTIARLEKKAGHFVAFSLIRLLIDFLFKILFIIYLERGHNGYFESTVIALLVVNIGLYTVFRTNAGIGINIRILKKFLRLGIPFVFSGFAIWVINASNQFFLNFLIGQSAVGVYAAGVQFAQIFNMLIYSPLSLLLPSVILSKVKDLPEENMYLQLYDLFHFLLIVGTIFCGLISLASIDLIEILIQYFSGNPGYKESLHLIPILTFSNFFYYISIPLGYTLLIKNKTEYVSFSGILAASLAVGLNLLLIKLAGVIGAAIATCSAYLFYSIFGYSLSNRKFETRFSMPKLITICVVAGIFILIVIQFPIDNIILSFFLKPTLFLLMFIPVLWFTPLGLNHSQKQVIDTYIKTILKK